MSVSMTPEKSAKVKEACSDVLHQDSVTIGSIASVKGIMVSSFPGVYHGPLFYHLLENEKTEALKHNGEHFVGKMILSGLARQELRCWIDNVDQEPQSIVLPPSKLTLRCNSSLLGWGSVIEGSGNPTEGRWSPLESTYYINYLELKAIQMCFLSLCRDLQLLTLKCRLIIKQQ